MNGETSRFVASEMTTKGSAMRPARKIWSVRPVHRVSILAAALLGLALFVHPAAAQIGSSRYASIVVDARSGEILSSVNPDETRYPASLTKMMTLYMTFEALRDRRIRLNQLVPVSPDAAQMPPTKLGLRPGTKITVEQAILGLVTKSANDAAAALGEMLGGSEGRFAQMMTLRARALGMRSTIFRNASGLPDPGQVTTARDMSLLGRRLIADFPSEYHYFAVPKFTFQGRTHRNHDRLLGVYHGADGLKTGFTVASGYNLVSSARRDGVRLVGVVMGGASGAERDRHMMSLLDRGFDRMEIPMARRATPGGSRFAGLISSAQAAPISLRPARVATRHSIQVGAFRSERDARAAARKAERVAEQGEANVQRVKVKGKTLWRAQVNGLTSSDANDTCRQLAKRKTPCVVLRPDRDEVASR